MSEFLPVSIGIGLAISLMFSEMFGLAAGGMVVPGYVALHLTDPAAVLLTLGAGLLTFIVVRLLGSLAIIYGRRRTVLMILIGYLTGGAVRYLLGHMGTDTEYAVIGYIIPGLIAIWLDRQGVIETFSSLVTASVVVRLVLIVALGPEFKP